jgi:hypothetical protein
MKKLVLLILMFLFVISCFSPKTEIPTEDESIDERYLEISVPLITTIEQEGGWQ